MQMNFHVARNQLFESYFFGAHVNSRGIT